MGQEVDTPTVPLLLPHTQSQWTHEPTLDYVSEYPPCNTTFYHEDNSIVSCRVQVHNIWVAVIVSLALQIVFTNFILKITFKFRQMGHVLILLDEMGLDEMGINLWD